MKIIAGILVKVRLIKELNATNQRQKEKSDKTSDKISKNVNLN